MYHDAQLISSSFEPSWLVTNYFILGNEDNAERETVAEVPTPVCPLVIEPEIDIEVSSVFLTMLTTVNTKLFN